jgi:SOS-response transcriptional repressor LexA
MDEPAFDTAKVAAAMAARKPRVTQTAMAKIMGLPSQSAFSNIMQGKRRVTADEARAAYEFLGIKQEPSIHWVPVIGIASAGMWREAIQLPLGRLPMPPGQVSDESFAVEISGDSMDKLIPDGGHIIVDPRQKELRDRKAYLIQNTDAEATVKLYRRDPPRFEPVSSNPDHKGWLVSECDFIVLGRVVMKVEAV